MRVICAGHVNWDVTLHVDHLPSADSEATIRSRNSGGGGSAANAAVAFTKLGADPAIVGSVGTDPNGRAAQDELTAHGVDTASLQIIDGQTAVKYLVVAPDGEAFVLGTDGVNEVFDPAAIAADTVTSGEHLHLTGQDPQTAAVLAELAAEHGLTVSFDPGRRSSGRPYERTLEHTDLLFLNRQEGKQIDVPDDCVVVRTFGEGGATVETGDRTVTHPGYAVDAVDSTGAGDAFAAGFVVTWLFAPEHGFEGALQVANACGALTAQHSGTRATLRWELLESIQRGSDEQPVRADDCTLDSTAELDG